MGDTPTEVVAGAVNTAASPVIPDPIVEEGDKHSEPAEPATDAVTDVEERIAEAVKSALDGHIATHHVAPVEHSEPEPDESPAAKPWTHKW